MGESVPPTATTVGPDAKHQALETIKQVSELIDSDMATLDEGLNKTSKDADIISTRPEFATVQESLDRIDKSIGNLANSIKELVISSTKQAKIGEVGESGLDTSDGSMAGLDEELLVEAESKSMECPNKTIPQVRRCNWEQFKNRYNGDEGTFAIEILVAGASLSSQMENENWKRMDHHERKAGGPVSVANMYMGFGNPQDPNITSHRTAHGEVDMGSWIQRIRINSRAVMRILGRFTDADKGWEGKPRTFMRPFRYLLHFHDNMKKELEMIKTKIAQAATTLKGATAKEDDKSQEEITLTDTAPDSNVKADSADNEQEKDADSIKLLYSSKETLEEVQCYVDFVEEHLLPLRHQFDSPDESRVLKVRYDDLAYLFQPGDLVCVPNSGEQRLSARFSTTQTIRRVYRVHARTYGQKKSTGCDCSSCKLTTVYSYYLDYDGEGYGCVTKPVYFETFDGEKDITDLPCYPIRYMKDLEKTLAHAKSNGTNFVAHISRRYGFYSGWSMIKSPIGEDLEDAKGDRIKSPEHIESDVLVDFSEAFNSYPKWKPDLETRTEQSHSVQTVAITFPVMTWKSPDRAEFIRQSLDSIVDDDGIGSLELNAYLERDVFLTKQNNQEPPIGDDLALLPRRMFAYAVWDRKFVHIDSRYLKRATQKGEESKAFMDLQIDVKNKRLIESLLKSHFKRKKDESEGAEVVSQDLIRGKGRGIVILLHGEPGVGKTATAEAVAQKYEKPLFPITCGDLGFTPEGVEKSLKEIFRLAHLWDCVLLLDEAEVFISQRDKNDLQRNALVSVFLRMLEYYNGVLFLTTNRVGVLDEAIKSRVHLHLRYDQLDKDQTLEIFKHNIGRLHKIELQRKDATDRLFIMETEVLDFAKTHFTESAEQGMGRWNGRQIRNAFLIAASLAHLDGDENSGMQRQLRKTHFEIVARTTMLYDRFRSSILNGPDSHVARERNERNDTFDKRSSVVMTSNQYGQFQHPPQHHPGPLNSASATQNGGASPRELPTQMHKPNTLVGYELPPPETGYGAQNPGQNRGFSRSMQRDDSGAPSGGVNWQQQYGSSLY